ncbi:hypothetical protein BV133_2242 [Blastochloris viridis]|uniref:Uncharacterized protein n=1 Tax=Blastochloris viridis TaxID=1079 RepID=A0A182D342_BLAVI|nr:hypothetical protein BV133_2242 [Blastochloris viridis]
MGDLTGSGAMEPLGREYGKRGFNDGVAGVALRKSGAQFRH